MAVRVAIANGNFSSTSTWDNGGILGIPTSGDVLFANGFTVLMDQNFTAEALVGGLYVGLPFGSQAEITPIMISNTSPSGICSASVNAATAWNAFDNNGATSWVGTSTTGWVRYQTSTPNIARGYSIYTAGNTTTTPRNWTFEGSNDGSIWTILDTRTGIAPSANSWASYIPTTTGSFTYYRLNVTAINGGATVTIVEFRPSLYYQSTSLGGSFNFNTAGVSVTGGTVSPSSTNLINVSAVSGEVSLTITSSPQLNASINPCINHSGNCNLTINSSAILGTGGVNGNVLIGKTSLGNLIVNSILRAQTSTTGSFVINFNTGTVIINGDVIGNILGGSGSHTINHVGGNLIVNGNVQGSLTNTTTYGINSAGTSLIVNGNVTGLLGSPILTSTPTTINGNIFGGTGSAGISTTAPLTISGSVFARAAAGISTTSAIAITVSGDVYASSTAVGISSTNASSNVNLTGNMYNSLGRNAIYCQNIFINNSATTLWRMDIGGGLTRTLYSADSFPNLPPTSDVRNLVQYGPASGLTGTMIVASPSDIRRNVLTDNTVGTADITAQDIINFINTSSDPLAIRMRTMLTDNSAGQLISEYNFV
jgi:hypothetical protein